VKFQTGEWKLEAYDEIEEKTDIKPECGNGIF
jgi:hypothetical protein